MGLGRAWLSTSDHVTWLVELGPDDDISEIEPVLVAFDLSHERAFPTLSREDQPDLAQVYLLHGSPADMSSAVSELRLDTENVDHLEPNLRLQFIDQATGSPADMSVLETRLLENDPLAPSQWELEATGAHSVHALLQSLQPVRPATVAILDTGVDATHEDLADVVTHGSIRIDSNGHGTHVAGTAAAVTNNRLGVASMNWEGAFIRIAAYQALSANGTGTLEGIAQAIVDATTDNVDVISMSLGADTGGPTPKVIRDAIAFALSRDIPVVVSAGNNGTDADRQFPANVDGVIVVGAVDRNLDRASFSNTTRTLERRIAAPGSNILSVRTGGGYVSMSGTSMATPAVSGLLGLLRALNPSLTTRDLWALIRDTATDIPAAHEIGPLLNSGAALQQYQISMTDVEGPLQNM